MQNVIHKGTFWCGILTCTISGCPYGTYYYTIWYHLKNPSPFYQKDQLNETGSLKASSRELRKGRQINRIGIPKCYTLGCFRGRERSPFNSNQFKSILNQDIRCSVPRFNFLCKPCFSCGPISQQRLIQLK